MFDKRGSVYKINKADKSTDKSAGDKSMDKSSSNNNSMLDARKSSNSANKNADSNERKSWNLNNFYSQEDRVNKANYAVFSDNNLDVQDD